MRTWVVIAGASTCLLLLALAQGCGDGEQADVRPRAISEAASLEEPPPKRASLKLREIYRQFQPPKPNPEVKGSGKAIRRGEAACRGKTPSDVKNEYIDESDLNGDQRQAVAKIGTYEKNPSPSFPAGQLGALVYQRAQSGDVLPFYGFQGCVYALSLKLKRELAPDRG